MDKKTIYDFYSQGQKKATMISLSTYKGKVILVVNTASKCGFTPQFEGLEKLWKDFGDKGYR